MSHTMKLAPLNNLMLSILDVIRKLLNLHAGQLLPSDDLLYSCMSRPMSLP